MLRQEFSGGRQLVLRRRRSRLPWVYLVYQDPCTRQGEGARGLPYPSPLTTEPYGESDYPSRRRNAGTSNADMASRSISPVSSVVEPPFDAACADAGSDPRSSACRLAIDRRPRSITGTSTFSFRRAVYCCRSTGVWIPGGIACRVAGTSKPVAMTVTLMRPSSLGSTTAPKMMFASSWAAS